MYQHKNPRVKEDEDLNLLDVMPHELVNTSH